MSWLSTLLGGEQRKQAAYAQQALMRQTQQAQQQANLMTDQLWKQINAGYGNTFADMMGLVQGQGDIARQGIADRYEMDRSSALQSLVDRGLGNTTVLDALNRGLLSDENRAYGMLDEQLRREKLGVYQVPLQQLQFQAGRTDQGPDMRMYATLMQMAGANASASPSWLTSLLGGLGSSIAGIGGSLLGKLF